ncbi:DUF7857 domain-containing protein [Salinigranum halophilum]|jgi:hypothetical protein|uniref:DUF7857 domain-containing protein n=1 Tax=Salinigranum halophilum TaxID=2565931 RepID=UPI0010A94C25|nr:hypothetical protein [Salinigranum halophilum]
MTHPSNPTPATDRAGDRLPADADTVDRDTCGSLRAGLLTVEWHVSRAAGATLVTVRVHNTHAAPREVRLENRLDGPVRPPRRHGVAEAGWDDDGVTRRVPGGASVSLGYACHAPPETPPVAVDDRPVGDSDDASPVDRALRSLGDHAPPRAVVLSQSVDEVDPSGDRPSTASPGDSVDTGDRSARRSTETSPRSVDERAAESNGQATARGSGTSDSPEHSVPTVVAAWFRAVEARLETADRLAGTVPEATPVVAAVGGRAGIDVLETTLEADAAALARVAARADDLAARIDATDVPDLEEPR